MAQFPRGGVGAAWDGAALRCPALLPVARLEVRLPQPRREEGPRPAEQGGEHRREGARQGAQLRDGLAGRFRWLLRWVIVRSSQMIWQRSNYNNCRNPDSSVSNEIGRWKIKVYISHWFPEINTNHGKPHVEEVGAGSVSRTVKAMLCAQVWSRSNLCRGTFTPNVVYRNVHIYCKLEEIYKEI